MPSNRMLYVLTVIACFLASSLSVISVGKSQSQLSENEQTLWNLEHEYWRHVQDNDLHAYLALWHKDFVGWPSVSAAPFHKDHITDWITSQTSKGLTLKSSEFKPAAMQITGDIAVLYYWLTYQWLDKDGNGAPHTIRVTHTWLKDGKEWRIIGGMSMPEAANPQR